MYVAYVDCSSCKGLGVVDIPGAEAGSRGIWVGTLYTFWDSIVLLQDVLTFSLPSIKP